MPPREHIEGLPDNGLGSLNVFGDLKMNHAARWHLAFGDGEARWGIFWDGVVDNPQPSVRVVALLGDEPRATPRREKRGLSR